MLRAPHHQRIPVDSEESQFTEDSQVMILQMQLMLFRLVFQLLHLGHSLGLQNLLHKPVSFRQMVSVRISVQQLMLLDIQVIHIIKDVQNRSVISPYREFFPLVYVFPGQFVKYDILLCLVTEFPITPYVQPGIS